MSNDLKTTSSAAGDDSLDRLVRADFFRKIERLAPHMLDDMNKRDGQSMKIIHTDELSEGDFEWVVSCLDDFWMDSFRTQGEAVSFCHAMGWPIVFISANVERSREGGGQPNE